MTNQFRSFRFAAHITIGALSFAGAALIATQASANPFALFAPLVQPLPQYQAAPQVVEPAIAPEADESNFELPARFKRQVVDYRTNEAPGTVIVDTPNTYLYLVMGNGKAMRYGIGVGREGFTWTGVKAVERKAEWPDWHPPAEMLQRQPYLPRFMAGGPGNPLGARAMYLGGTVYRIHGTNQPSTIGSQVSSGCIRLTNADVSDLYERVKVGARVVVLPMHGGARAQIEQRHAEPRQSVAVAQPGSPTFVRANGIY
jgi:lipoprotein-anchoring transpeptidase ErfK/SrfK